MSRAEIEKKLAPHLDKMDVAAPVDPERLFRGGLDVKREIRGKKVVLDGKRAVVVTGSVDVGELTVKADALVVFGNVRAEKIHVLESDVVVMGRFDVRDFLGETEPGVLTVMGASNVGRAAMKHQYIVQLLGGGRVELLVDDEGGADELVEILADAGSKLRVGRMSDDLRATLAKKPAKTPAKKPAKKKAVAKTGAKKKRAAKPAAKKAPAKVPSKTVKSASKSRRR